MPYFETVLVIIGFGTIAFLILATIAQRLGWVEAQPREKPRFDLVGRHAPLSESEIDKLSFGLPDWQISANPEVWEGWLAEAGASNSSAVEFLAVARYMPSVDRGLPLIMCYLVGATQSLEEFIGHCYTAEGAWKLEHPKGDSHAK